VQNVIHFAYPAYLTLEKQLLKNLRKPGFFGKTAKPANCTLCDISKLTGVHPDFWGDHAENSPVHALKWGCTSTDHPKS
jgi:hypothetical protein